MDESNRHRLKIVFAALIAVVGVGLAWRAMGPVRQPTSALPAPADEVAAPARSQPSYPLPAALRTDVSLETIDDVMALLRRRLQGQIDAAGAGTLSAIMQEALLEESLTVLHFYLTRDFDAYEEYLRAGGAKHPLLLGDDVTPEKREHQKSFWLVTVEGYTLRPIGVDEVAVRARFIQGREVEQPQLGGTGTLEADRFPVPRDPAAGRLTIYEVVVPVLYEWRGVRGPVWWGIWFAWDAPRDRWVIWRMTSYDPANVGPNTIPTF